MIKNLLVFIVCVLTVYGAFNIVMEIFNSIHNKLKLKNSTFKILLAVKNQEETVEGITNIVRRMLQKDLPESRLIVLDMGSNDDTLKILRKLEEKYYYLDVHEEQDGERILKSLTE